jgi:NifU-like protein involved in Fe-S cluster formation
MSAQRLYTPAMLAAATRLSRFPLRDEFALRGEARSPSCGSRIVLGLTLDDAGRISGLGVAAHTCAVGQASAALFAEHGCGHDAREIAAAREAVARWVSEDGPRPDWPGLELIEPARAFPGRHGAMLLAWDAAVRAMEPEKG